MRFPEHSYGVSLDLEDSTPTMLLTLNTHKRPPKLRRVRRKTSSKAFRTEHSAPNGTRSRS